MGLLALGERMPRTLGMQALRLLSWLCITVGVSALAGGRGRQLVVSISAFVNKSHSIGNPVFSKILPKGI